MSRPIHFEIHASNPQRATDFYSAVFGWKFKKWEGSVDYWMVMTGLKGVMIKDKEDQGIDGGLLIRKGPAPIEGQPVNAYVCTIDVQDIDAYVKKVVKAGGIIVNPKMAVPEIGWLVYCNDTEGNIFGMIQNDTKAQ